MILRFYMIISDFLRVKSKFPALVFPENHSQHP